MSTVPMKLSPMTVLEQEKPPVFETVGKEPPRRRRWPSGALVLAVLVLVGLGAWLGGVLYADHHHGAGEQAAVTTTVTAWMDAFNAHDATMVWGRSSRTWTWQSAGGVTGQAGPYTGAEFLGVISSDWTVDPRSGIQPLGEPVVLDEAQVAIPARLVGLSGVTSTSPHGGVLLFNLTTQDGERKVAEIVWLSSR